MIAKDVVELVLNKADLLLDGKCISKEALLQDYYHFLAGQDNGSSHRVGLIQHTGSICFDALALLYATISCLLGGSSSQEDFIQNLSIGDAVLYTDAGKRKQYTFEGITINDANKKEYIILKQGTQKIFLPKGLWNQITPYFGNAKSTSGKGVRKKNPLREAFFIEVLGYKSEEVPSIIDKSVVLVIPKDECAFLVKNIELRFGDKTIRINDLLPVSYFTESEEYPFAGNAEKAEAALKITGKISTARDLVFSTDGNPCLGVLLFDQSKYIDECANISQIAKRKSIQYFYMLMDVTYSGVAEIVDAISCESDYYACTKELLHKNPVQNDTNSVYLGELRKQTKRIINCDRLIKVLPGFIEWTDYYDFRKTLRDIKDYDYLGDEKDNFILTALFLNNLFYSAPFTMRELNVCCENKTLLMSPPETQLNALKEYMLAFPPKLHELADKIVFVLEYLLSVLTDQNAKRDALISLLRENSWKRVALIVPKTYYSTVLTNSTKLSSLVPCTKIYITTANRFDSSLDYDAILVFGNHVGKAFDALRCFSSDLIVSVIYDFEKRFYDYRVATMKNDPFGVCISPDVVLAASVDAAVSEITAIDNEFDEFVNKLNGLSVIRRLSTISQSGSPTAETVAMGVFETGERIFFTRYFKAYVYNSAEGTMSELSVSELNEGDDLVFTKNNTDAHDVVDSILDMLISDKKVSEETIQNYVLSKRWKSALVDYMKKTGLSPRSIAEMMIKAGAQVQDSTIRVWLDEDSHTVGPRRKDSIEQIAVLVEDEWLLSNCDAVFEACALIRKLRRNILEEMGKAIRRSITGAQTSGGIYSFISERVDSIVEVLRLESITTVKQSVPMNYTNRPIREC